MSTLTSHEDTICALATAPGGAISIIRVSGPQALSIAGSLCALDVEHAVANTIHYTHIVNGKGEMIDEVMLSIFRSPRSYTGEDSVEISCHGSRYIARQVLELLVNNGCRMAQPGEFTQRAYLNGKMDLSQAEAVADLIAANNKATHDIALSQLRGNFSSQLATLREQLLRLTSLLELELDFSDHEDLEFADRTELQKLAQTIHTHITRLAHSFETGQALKQGIPVAIVGKTNVGKSTLLNRLLRDDRAIVSDVHGTTRDTIEDTIDIHGVTFRFIDTAGIRETTDTVEQIGIQRTFAAIEKARIVLWLIDQQPTSNDIKEILQASHGKSLIIIQNKIDREESIKLQDFLTKEPINLNEIDSKEPINLQEILTNESINLNEIGSKEPINIQDTLPDSTSCATFLKISAKHNLHIDDLEQAIYAAANIPALSDTDVIVTNARHYEALINSNASLQRVLDGLHSDLPGDLLAEDLRLTLSSLADITGGAITPQETLSNIFQHFCVGK